MINNVVLVGRLTADLMLKQNQNGNGSRVGFNLAVGRAYKDNNGEQQTDFIKCVAFNKQAENLARYCGRGSLIGVEGRIQTRNYQDSNTGNTVYVTEVIVDRVQFLESKQQRQQQGQFNQGFNQQNNGFTAQQAPDAMNYIQQPPQQAQNGYNQQQMQMGSTGIANNNNLWTDGDFQNIPNPFQED